MTIPGSSAAPTPAPTIGEYFVDLEASPDEWEEVTQQIADVLGPSETPNCWLVEWGQAGSVNVPEVLEAKYGDRLRQGRITVTEITFRDGKWRRP